MWDEEEWDDEEEWWDEEAYPSYETIRRWSEKDMTFEEWLTAQLTLQRDVYGTDPRALQDEERARYLTWNAYALIDELSELMDEVQWKPWAQNMGMIISRERAVGEAVDMLHFMANILLTLDVTGEELAERYRAKQQVNGERQERGYLGALEKCPSCKRDLKEVGAYSFEIPLETLILKVTQCAACYAELERVEIPDVAEGS